MITIGGCLVVLGAILIGFTMAGDQRRRQDASLEVVTIGGASFGYLINMSPKSVLMDLLRCVIQFIKSTPAYTAADSSSSVLVTDLSHG